MSSQPTATLSAARAGRFPDTPKKVTDCTVARPFRGDSGGEVRFADDESQM